MQIINVRNCEKNNGPEIIHLLRYWPMLEIFGGRLPN